MTRQSPSIRHCRYPVTTPHPPEWWGLPIPRRYWAVLGVWMALVVCVLDASIANVALPSIAHDLKTTPADSIAVVSSFQLGALVSLLPLPAFAEIATYRRVFLC